MEQDTTTPAMGNVVRIDEERIRDHLGQIVRGTVEDTRNALLDAEADRLRSAARYGRTEARRDTRAGSYRRGLHTRAGEVTLKGPKPRRQAFETAVIERYRRRETSVEEALIEMSLAGVSVRRVEDVTEALRGTRVSPGTVSRLNRKISARIAAWRDRPIRGAYPHLYPDGVVLKRSRARSATSRSWSRSGPRPGATARSWASARGPRRTRPAGRASWRTSRGAASPASG